MLARHASQMGHGILAEDHVGQCNKNKKKNKKNKING
jgi:hypothetical protein